MSTAASAPPPPSAAPPDTVPWWRDRGVLTLVAGAALLRLALGAHLWTADPLLRALLSDAAYYDRWARALAEGQPWREGLPHWLPPLYPWLLGALYRVTGGALAATLVVQSSVGVLVTAAVARLAWTVTDRTTGLVAGWLWTLYLPVVLFETRLLGVNAAVPLCVVSLAAGLATVRRLERGRSAVGLAALCGLAAGVACLARPNLLLSLPGAGLGALAAWLLARRMPPAPGLVASAAAVLIGLAAGTAPGLASNLERSGQPVLVTANGGVNFWFGNNAEAHGTFHAPGPEWGSIEDQRDVSMERAANALGREVDEREASAWWFDEGRAWIAAHPGDAMRLWGLKLADSLSSTEFGIQYYPASIRVDAPGLWLAPLPFGLLLGLAALGVGRVRHRGALLGWIAAGVAASLLYFTYSRFRLPWLPALLPFSAAGLLQLLAWLRRAQPLDRRGGLSLLVGAGLLAQSFVPFEGNYPRLVFEHARGDSANGWVELGRRATADERWSAARGRFERALAVDPLRADATYELGGVLVRATDRGVFDPEAAIALLEDWVERAPTDREGRNEIEALLGATLVQARPLDADARGRARRLAQGVLARDATHPGARALLDAIGG